MPGNPWTHDELKAIASLQRLGKRWPTTLTLLSCNGSLTVVPTKDYVDDTLSIHRAYEIDGIPNDGGTPEWDGDAR